MKINRNILNRRIILPILLITASILAAIGSITAVAAITGSENIPGAGQVNYFHSDMTGNTRVVTNERGEVISFNDYTPFGERLKGQPHEDSFRPKYSGKETDSETGLSYFGARFYQPAIGQWTQPDPAEQFHYAYLSNDNNPITHFDPDGQISFEEFIELDGLSLAKLALSRLSGSRKRLSPVPTLALDNTILEQVFNTSYVRFIDRQRYERLVKFQRSEIIRMLQGPLKTLVLKGSYKITHGKRLLMRTSLLKRNLFPETGITKRRRQKSGKNPDGPEVASLIESGPRSSAESSSSSAGSLFSGSSAESGFSHSRSRISRPFFSLPPTSSPDALNPLRFEIPSTGTSSSFLPAFGFSHPSTGPMPTVASSPATFSSTISTTSSSTLFLPREEALRQEMFDDLFGGTEFDVTPW